MNGALAVSLGAHSVVVAIWLVLQTVPAPNPAPQVTAEVELVLGSGGQALGETEAGEGQDLPAQPPGQEAPDRPPAQPLASEADTVAAPRPPARPAEPPTVRVGDTQLGPTADLLGNDGRFRAAEGDSGNLPPPYPRAAGARRQQGAVLARMHVDANGQVVQVEVLKSSGSPILDRAAHDALAKWHFTPALRDGEPVADVVDLNINFRLD
jgi:protein TonB